jgi:hypothetical protein
MCSWGAIRARSHANRGNEIENKNSSWTVLIAANTVAVGAKLNERLAVPLFGCSTEVVIVVVGFWQALS